MLVSIRLRIHVVYQFCASRSFYHRIFLTHRNVTAYFIIRRGEKKEGKKRNRFAIRWIIVFFFFFLVKNTTGGTFVDRYDARWNTKANIEQCWQRKCIVNICTYRAISPDQFETCYAIGIETKFNVDNGKLWIRMDTFAPRILTNGFCKLKMWRGEKKKKERGKYPFWNIY